MWAGLLAPGSPYSPRLPIPVCRNSGSWGFVPGHSGGTAPAFNGIPSQALFGTHIVTHYSIVLFAYHTPPLLSTLLPGLNRQSHKKPSGRHMAGTDFPKQDYIIKDIPFLRDSLEDFIYADG
jgi:hypothetical protein